jgi:hypothetical protein
MSFVLARLLLALPAFSVISFSGAIQSHPSRLQFRIGCHALLIRLLGWSETDGVLCVNDCWDFLSPHFAPYCLLALTSSLFRFAFGQFYHLVYVQLPQCLLTFVVAFYLPLPSLLLAYGLMLLRNFPLYPVDCATFIAQGRYRRHPSSLYLHANPLHTHENKYTCILVIALICLYM